MHRLATLVILDPDLGTIELTVGKFDRTSARHTLTLISACR
jgi:hypothetical protein